MAAVVLGDPRSTTGRRGWDCSGGDGSGSCGRPESGRRVDRESEWGSDSGGGLLRGERVRVLVWGVSCRPVDTTQELDSDVSGLWT
ncbi:putative pollen-specific leucine-rich repeat extensin-like protein 3 [Iris pallida]|uniref:Pollen-specific leucine-rich repeat extensin-like protein 3 n=1 Tax=Iris pallida TaxID=29817 RepID=A0AAX6H7E9_IRIPA|nr:putative pollen-specific leucine-rich repeat extensin-like protein 3 [Iris pallida]